MEKQVMSSRRKSMKRFVGLVAGLAVATVMVRVLADGERSSGTGGTGARDGFDVGDGVVRLSGQLDRSAVLASGDGEVKLELVLAAANKERATVVPTDLVVVLDPSVSTSVSK